MNFKDQLESLVQNLLALDPKKQLLIGMTLLVSLAAAIFLSYQFGKPLTAPLYSELSREDLNSMSRILSENGVEFEIASETGSIAVVVSKTAQARMLLAEHGLPSSQESGYELFDQVNTLGLTSFMQSVTNKRAIEGELVRTIQIINGVKSARVHLVMEDKKVFGRNRGAPPSASVVLKTYGKLSDNSINAIRHMVAAAVPRLETSNVTIIGADGTLMTSNNDLASGFSSLVELEREYEQDIENKIIAALGAHLGNENLRVSATVKLNNDKRRVDETVFDPDSRVERSVQVVREAGTTENKESASPATVDQNLPEEEVSGGAGQLSLENSERREELTNYEINEKKISVVSDGYLVENISVAVVVNKTRLEELIEGNPTSEQIELKSSELKAIAEAAVSMSGDRGDKMHVNLVEFMPVEGDLAEASNNPIMAFFAVHFSGILNALGLVIAAVLFAVLGIRPMLSALTNKPNTPEIEGATGVAAQIEAGNSADPSLLDAPAAAFVEGADSVTGEPLPQSANSDKAEWEADLDLIAVREAQLKEKLGGLVSQSEQRAAKVIKNWLQEVEQA